MARHLKNTFADILPILKSNGIGAVSRGLVSGKTQTVYPWDEYQEPDRYTIPFHDIFSKDGELLLPEEAEVFERYIVHD